MIARFNVPAFNEMRRSSKRMVVQNVWAEKSAFRLFGFSLSGFNPYMTE